MIIREADESDAAAIALVHVASWQDTYGGIIPDACLAGLSVEVKKVDVARRSIEHEQSTVYMRR